MRAAFAPGIGGASTPPHPDLESTAADSVGDGSVTSGRDAGYVRNHPDRSGEPVVPITSTRLFEASMIRNTTGARRTAAVLVAMLFPLVASCGRNDVTNGIALDPLDALSAQIPGELPGIRGTITLVQPGDSVAPTGTGGNPDGPIACPPSCGSSGQPMRSVLIEEVPGGHGDDKSYVKVPRAAVLLRRTAAGVEQIGFSDLRVGEKVETWFSGPVAESYPTQSTARVILVVP